MALPSAVSPTVDAAVGAALHSSDTWPPTDASTAVTDASSAVPDTSTAVADVSTARGAENKAYCGCRVACVCVRWCVYASLSRAPSPYLSRSVPFPSVTLVLHTRTRTHAHAHAHAATQQQQDTHTHTYTHAHTLPHTQVRGEGVTLTQRPLTRQRHQRPHKQQHKRPHQRPEQGTK